MPVLLLGILFVWTVVVFRAICFRTTLSPRTILTCIALGAPLGVVANPLAEKFFNSYRFDGSQYYTFLIIVVQHLLMVAPALLLLARPAWRRGSSVCDGFLVAFAIGTGYEFFGLLLALAPASTVASGLSFLPPGIVSNATTSFAGYGYWGGLVALICAAAFRFLRIPVLSWVAAALALLASSLDHFADISATPESAQVARFLLHGSLLPWLTIVLLIAGVFWELRWSNSKTALKDAADTFQAVVSATAGFKWNEAKLAGTRYQLSRESENLSAEQQREPANAAIASQTRFITGLLAKLATAAPAPQPSFMEWLRRRWLQVLAIFALLCLGIFFNMPSMATVSNRFWASLSLAATFAPFQLTLAATILVVLLLWRFIQAPRQPFSRAVVDEVAQFSAERLMIQTGLGVVLLALLYPHPAEFTAFQSTLARAAGLQVPGYNEPQALTLLLVLLWAMGTLTVRRAEQWRQNARADFLPGVIRNLISLCSIAAIAWLGLAFFTQIQVFAHARWGADFFNLYQTNGNSILEMVLGLVVIVFTFGIAWLVRKLAERVEHDLLGSAESRPVESRPGRSQVVPQEKRS